MQTPTFPQLLSEKIVLRDRSGALDATARVAALERIARFAECHDYIVRIAVELERNEHAISSEAYVAKGQLELSGPELLTSVVAAEPSTALSFLLENFDRHLRRRRVMSVPLARAGG